MPGDVEQTEILQNTRRRGLGRPEARRHLPPQPPAPSQMPWRRQHRRSPAPIRSQPPSYKCASYQISSGWRSRGPARGAVRSANHGNETVPIVAVAGQPHTNPDPAWVREQLSRST
ncbi:hypothetical protein GTW64_02980 [Streptomyces sp. SID4923]|nr:hypothetical protein [Streptomyces sp. SID4923]